MTQHHLPRSFPLHYTLHTWGIGLFLQIPLPTVYIARKVMDNVERAIASLKSKCLVDSVGCSVVTVQAFEVYVHFDVPPEASMAIKILSRAYEGLDPLRVDLVNPFTMDESDKDKCPLKTADLALQTIRDNEAEIKKRVTSGREYSLVKNDPLHGL